MTHTGFFSLRTPQDLFAKAQADLADMESQPGNQRAAFNFFITARHIPDWLYPNDSQKKKQLFDKHVELRICRHLAEGAKHFEATNNTHKQVTGTSAFFGGFQSNAFQNNAFQIGGGLTVQLDDNDPETISLGKSVSTTVLAKKVISILQSIINEESK